MSKFHPQVFYGKELTLRVEQVEGTDDFDLIVNGISLGVWRSPNLARGAGIALEREVKRIVAEAVRTATQVRFSD